MIDFVVQHERRHARKSLTGGKELPPLPHEQSTVSALSTYAVSGNGVGAPTYAPFTDSRNAARCPTAGVTVTNDGGRSPSVARSWVWAPCVAMHGRLQRQRVEIVAAPCERGFAPHRARQVATAGCTIYLCLRHIYVCGSRLTFPDAWRVRRRVEGKGQAHTCMLT